MEELKGAGILRKLGRILTHDGASLKMRSLRAASWTIMGRGCGEALRFISNLVLTRLLFPEAFGLMATVTTVLAMIQLLSDTGVRLSIIQSPKGASPDYLNSAWVISIGRGFILFVFMLAVTWPVASYYGQPDLKGLLLLLSFGIAISGFENPGLALLVKDLHIHKQVRYELVTQILGMVTTISLAFALRSVWALAIGSLCVTIYKTAGSYIAHPYRPRFTRDREAMRELYHFGKFILLNTMVAFLANNLDRLMMGKLLTMDMLGCYSIAITMGTMVEMVLIQISNQSYFPAVSSVQRDFQRTMRIYGRTAAFAVALATPVLMVLCLLSKDIVGILYDSRYQLTSVALFWISLRGVFGVISVIQSGTFFALGKIWCSTVPMAVGFVAVLLLLPPGAGRYGFQGVCIAVFVSGVLISIAESILLGKVFHYPFRVVLKPWLQTLATGGAITLIFILLKPFLATQRFHNIPFIIIMALLGLLVSAALLVAFEGTHPFRDMGGATKEDGT